MQWARSFSGRFGLRAFRGGAQGLGICICGGVRLAARASAGRGRFQGFEFMTVRPTDSQYDNLHPGILDIDVPGRSYCRRARLHGSSPIVVWPYSCLLTFRNKSVSMKCPCRLVLVLSCSTATHSSTIRKRTCIASHARASSWQLLFLHVKSRCRTALGWITTQKKSILFFYCCCSQ